MTIRDQVVQGMSPRPPLPNASNADELKAQVDDIVAWQNKRDEEWNSAMQRRHPKLPAAVLKLVMSKVANDSIGEEDFSKIESAIDAEAEWALRVIQASII